MLLTVSETFSAFWESAVTFIQQCWVQLTASVSISAVVIFIVKYIMYKIKNNKTITNAITKATGAVSQSTDVLNKRIDAFEQRQTEMFNKFEEKFEKQFEEKFVDLKNKRKQVYYSIMEGTEAVKETLGDVKDLAEQIETEIKKEPEKPDVKELEEALNVDEIKEGATDLQKQAQEAIVEAVDETIKTTEKHISKNQVLR
jgi:hypothetical protein